MEEKLGMGISWVSVTLRQMNQRPADFSAVCSSELHEMVACFHGVGKLLMSVRLSQLTP